MAAGEFVDRGDRESYPGCASEIAPPLAGGAAYSWDAVAQYCMGAGASGLSGVIIEGKLLCSGSASTLNDWLFPPE